MNREDSINIRCELEKHGFDESFIKLCLREVD